MCISVDRQQSNVVILEYSSEPLIPSWVGVSPIDILQIQDHCLSSELGSVLELVRSSRFEDHHRVVKL